MRILLSAILIGFCGPLLLSCGPATSDKAPVDFTRADSLTDHYLSLHDSIHLLWNVMINDDNGKINSMHNLLHELIVSHPEEMESLRSLEERLNQLMRMRYTQKSMSNTDVVNEYDFASNSLVTEIVASTEQKKEYSYNTTLQKLVIDIRQAEERMAIYRFEYDSAVNAYNLFIEENKDFLQQTDETLTLEKKPLFRMVSDD